MILMSISRYLSHLVATKGYHLTGTATSRAYNRTIYLSERITMMQSWADYLEAVRDGADVVSTGAK